MVLPSTTGPSCVSLTSTSEASAASEIHNITSPSLVWFSREKREKKISARAKTPTDHAQQQANVKTRISNVRSVTQGYIIYYTRVAERQETDNGSWKNKMSLIRTHLATRVGRAQPSPGSLARDGQQQRGAFSQLVIYAMGQMITSSSSTLRTRVFQYTAQRSYNITYTLLITHLAKVAPSLDFAVTHNARRRAYIRRKRNDHWCGENTCYLHTDI